jgi:MoaA/NifB/PqqE/SkfB family radical SAM enzyme
VNDPGSVAPPPLPRSLYVETTSRCNSLCETCILTFGGREAPKDLGYPEFRRIVDQFSVLERVVLHGIGEPLLNRELPAMIEHAKARARTSCSTPTPSR